MGSYAEIEEAIDTCYRLGNEQLVILQCVTAYPTPPEECNLNVIKTLKTAFDVHVGLSDHTLDPVDAPITAVAIGASVLEKHFTISKTLEGPDHPAALEPHELSEMVTEIRKVEKMEDKIAYVTKRVGKEKLDIMLGSYRKTIAPSEEVIYPNDKRSIHAINEIKEGSRLTKENIAVLRSERNLNPGMPPKFYHLILGKKVNKDISYSQGITWEDLLS